MVHLKEEPFGTAKKFTWFTESGFSVSAISYGAIITSINVSTYRYLPTYYLQWFLQTEQTIKFSSLLGRYMVLTFHANPLDAQPSITKQ